MRTKAFRCLALAGLEQYCQTGEHTIYQEGMQQRVAIFRALNSRPLHSPHGRTLGALDAITREDMSYTLLKIWQQRVRTVLFVTHSVERSGNMYPTT